MNKQNFTPGPWKVMYSSSQEREFFLAVWPANTVDGYVGSPICKVSPEHLMNETDEANGRLIAAAPELLEALQGMLKWADRTVLPQLGTEMMPKGLEKWQAIARNAAGEKEVES